MERCLNLHIMRVFLIKFLVAPSNILTILTSIHKLTEIGFGAILVQSEIFCLKSLCGLLQVFPTLHNFREKMWQFIMIQFFEESTWSTKIAEGCWSFFFVIVA